MNLSITDLEKAEGELASEMELYSKSTPERLLSLLRLCERISNVKEVFFAVPKRDRPAKSWGKYAPILATRCKLQFATGRMADSYVALHADLQRVEHAEIEKRVSDPSYRELRKVVSQILKVKSPAGDPCRTVLKEIRAAAKCLERATAASDDGPGSELISDLKAQTIRLLEAYEKRWEPFLPAMILTEDEAANPELRRRVELLSFVCRAAAPNQVAADASRMLAQESLKLLRNYWLTGNGSPSDIEDQERALQPGLTRIWQSIREHSSGGRPHFTVPFGAIEVAVAS